MHITVFYRNPGSKTSLSMKYDGLERQRGECACVRRLGVNSKYAVILKIEMKKERGSQDAGKKRK